MKRQHTIVDRFAQLSRYIAIADCIEVAIQHNGSPALLRALRSLMFENVTIGSTPHGENCAQVGADGYEVRARAECGAFMRQLRRVAEVAHNEGRLGEEAWTRLADGRAQLIVKGCPHDLGTYHEVQLRISAEDEASWNLALFFDSNTPEFWDDEARTELNAEQERLNLVINQGGWTRP